MRYRTRNIGILLELAFGLAVIVAGVLPALSAPQDPAQNPPAKSSADRPADNKAVYQPASLPYTGFRVVRGAPQPKK